MTATSDKHVLKLVKQEVSHALDCIFGDSPADDWIDLWEATPSFDQLNDAANSLIRAANRVAPDGHRAPE